MLNLQKQSHCLCKQAKGAVLTGQEYSFFVTVPSSKGSSMFDNEAMISPGTVRGCFDASFA